MTDIRPGDYYMEDGLLVFTTQYLQRRGYCCGSGCRHCPYGPVEVTPQEPPPGGEQPACERSGDFPAA